MAGDLLAFDDAVQLLKSGGVLLSGTDTLPGFHCRADLIGSVELILKLKGRPAGKSLLVLAGSFAQARLVTGDLDSQQAEYCRRCWPGPFSLILPAGKGLPAPVVSDSGAVAVRVPAVASLRSLVLAVGFPVVSTSANKAGKAPCPTLASAAEEFRNEINGCWQPPETKSDTEDEVNVTPSALIDVTVWPPALLRSGPVDPPGTG